MTLIFSWVRFFDQNFFRILFSSAPRAHPPQEELCLTEGSCSGVQASLPRLPTKRERRASTQKYLRGLDNLCSRAAYVNFLTPFHAAYNQATE